MKSSDKIITSTQNTRVKKLILLQQKSAERRKAGLFVVEGRRELLHCLHSGYEIDTLFYCPQLLFVAGEDGELRSPPTLRWRCLPRYMSASPIVVLPRAWLPR